MLTEKNRKWWILVAMSSTISMIFVDVTVLPVALPTIQKLLNFSDLTLQWIVNCYTLTLAILILAGGRLSDIFGAKKIFCYGVCLFAFASALCGLSNTEISFITSRVLQGVGGALLIPSTSLIIFSSFPPHERGKAFGIFISIGSIFLSLGPFIGGVLTEYVNWRYVFWINLPIAALGYSLALYSVPKSTTKKEQFDYLGFATISSGVSALVIGIMQSKHWGWSSPLTLGLIIVGVILIVLLALFERSIPDPFIDFKFFKNRNFVGAVFSTFCTQFIVMATVFWAIYFQMGLSFTPVEAGILALLANIPVMIAAPIGGYLLDRFGPKLPMTIGYSLLAGSLIWFSQVLDVKSMPVLLTAIIPFGCAIPLIFSPSFNAAMHEAIDNKRGMVSGLIGTIRQFGATLGMAIFGALFLESQISEFSKALAKNPETQNLNPNQFEGLLARAPPAMEAVRNLPESMQEYIKSSDLNAYITAFYNINLLTILMAVLGFTVTLFCIKKKK